VETKERVKESSELPDPNNKEQKILPDIPENVDPIEGISYLGKIFKQDFFAIAAFF